MRIDLFFYRLAYRHGRPRWDSTQPRPELAGLLQDRPPGHHTSSSTISSATRPRPAIQDRPILRRPRRRPRGPRQRSKRNALRPARSTR